MSKAEYEGVLNEVSRFYHLRITVPLRISHQARAATYLNSCAWRLKHRRCAFCAYVC
jgi:hypothetical protein